MLYRVDATVPNACLPLLEPPTLRWLQAATLSYLTSRYFVVAMDEDAAPSTDSPPARPSAWQIRFGKKPAPRLKTKDNSLDTAAGRCQDPREEARSPSISEQLLRALDAGPLKKEALSRDCVDVLIGRRNAFADEPELRLRTLKNRGASEDTPACDPDQVAAEAKQIIRLRFQIETQADLLRQTRGHRQRPKRREAEYPTKARTSTAAKTPINMAVKSSSRSSRTGSRCQEKKVSHDHLVTQNIIDNQEAEMKSTPEDSLPHQQSKHLQLHMSSSSHKKKTRPRQSPPQQLPMERRQKLLQQAREARKIKTAEEQALLALLEPTTSENNKEDVREQRRIEEKIQRLAIENQQAAALEDRLQQRKARLEFLNKAFGSWSEFVEFKREQATRVVAEFNWQTAKKIMTSWKRYMHRQRQARVAEQARLKLVKEQQLKDRAIQLHRRRCLPQLFYRWSTFVAQQEEQRAAERATQKRRAQTERLMERLQQREYVGETCKHVIEKNEVERMVEGIERQPSVAGVIESSPRTNNRTSSSTQVLTSQRKKCAWPRSEEYETERSDGRYQSSTIESHVQTTPSPQLTRALLTQTTQRVDRVYKAMEQRAIERKQRREELKQKYDELEQKKRQEQEKQRAALEELLHQKRTEEKARIRERKLAEALALKEKQERRDHLIAQQHKASKHNRRRLLFYYALLPWRKYHALNERVSRLCGDMSPTSSPTRTSAACRSSEAPRTFSSATSTSRFDVLSRINGGSSISGASSKPVEHPPTLVDALAQTS
ncbi:unnamed protein product [Phytophthora lilii]|uniref:Unnamed protein product n=1 Tax=Phytophthora lilii TaxID=2077276 RepID=A0A9W6U586_9STRA|nr:unnamed protein product [Phytophthora lilii]